MDLHRVLLGDAEFGMLVEIVFRTTTLYLFTFLLIRITSRRTVGQVSLGELLLIVALGSAVGDPMFYADVPVLHGMTVIAVVVGLEKALGSVLARSRRFERLVEGSPIRAVSEGHLDLPGMAALELAPEELYQLLRGQGVEHLGQVRAAYLEQNGTLSLFRYAAEEERHGLRIEPPEDLAPPVRFRIGTPVPLDGDYCCLRCGWTERLSAEARFEEHAAGHHYWTTAARIAPRQSL